MVKNNARVLNNSLIRIVNALSNVMASLGVFLIILLTIKLLIAYSLRNWIKLILIIITIMLSSWIKLITVLIIILIYLTLNDLAISSLSLLIILNKLIVTY